VTVFTSDNAAGAHPEVLAAIARVAPGRAVAYGDDAHTARALACLRAHFGAQVEALLVWGGTAANVIGLAAVVEPWQAVLCAETAHLALDECGAAERFIGCKLVPVPARHGKVAPAQVRAHLRGRGVVHHAQPRVLSVAQPTELGTVYQPDELAALAALCHEQGLLLHIDGARLPAAAAHLDCSLGAITTDVGADLLSFGGTKSGLLGAEAVVLLRPEVARGAPFHRKQGMQLASKMRFLAAQIEALLAGDLWRRVARHANAAAARLADGVRDLPHVELVHPVESNAVFARLPAAAVAALRGDFQFLIWDGESAARPTVRWMTAFDTTDEDVDRLVAAVAALACEAP
jgi:threonine aldolase